MARTAQKFRSAVLEHGLVSESAVEAAWKAGTKPDDDAQPFAKRLVRAGALTKYQAALVYQGRASALVLGNYEIRDRIGAGGMGQVFLARHRRMQRDVALKLLSPEMMGRAGAVERFQREIQAISAVSHPNLVTAYDADEASGVHFLVMEYVPGRPLDELVKSRGPRPIGRSVEYIRQAALGLKAAHDSGIVHRDLKPANLLLSESGVVKVLDLGLARIASSDDGTGAELTGTGQIMGTVDYMSPEQAADTRRADARSDVYSLGCTLWFLLAGAAPFGGETLMLRLLAHREEPVPSIRNRRPDVPEELDTLLHRMMAKSPQDRFGSMDELLAALDHLSVSEESHSPDSPVDADDNSDLGDIALLDFLGGIGDAGPSSEAGTSYSRSTSRSAEQRKAVPTSWLVSGGIFVACSVGVMLLFSGPTDDVVSDRTSTPPAIEPPPDKSDPGSEGERQPDPFANLTAGEFPGLDYDLPDTESTRAALGTFLALGAVVELEQHGRGYRSVDDLPEGDFVAYELTWYDISSNESRFLERLPELKGLAVLGLSGEGITDASMVIFDRLPNLYYLSLSSPQLTGTGVGRLESLQTLHLVGESLTKQGVAEIEQCAGLRTIKVAGTTLDTGALEILKTLKSLSAVELVALPKVTDEIGTTLMKCESLTSLRLTNLPSVTDALLHQLSQHPTLRVLNLARCEGITPAGIKAIEEAKPECKVTVQ